MVVLFGTLMLGALALALCVALLAVTQVLAGACSADGVRSAFELLESSPVSSNHTSVVGAHRNMHSYSS